MLNSNVQYRVEGQELKKIFAATLFIVVKKLGQCKFDFKLKKNAFYSEIENLIEKATFK